MVGRWTTTGPRWWPPTLLLATAVAAAAAFRIDDQTPVVPAGWPAAGLAVLAVLAVPPGLFWLLAGSLGAGLAVAAGSVAGGREVDASAGLGVAQALGVLVLVLVLERTTTDKRLRPFAGVDDVVRFTVAAVAGALVAGGVVALLTGPGAGLGLGNATGSGEALRTLATASVTAVLVLVPLALVPRGKPGPSLASGEEAALQVLALLAALAFVFHPEQRLPVTFAFLAVVAWGALRLGPRAVLLETILVAATAGVAELRGWGPIGNARETGLLDPARAAGLTQALVLVSVAVALPLGVHAQQRRLLMARLASDEQRYRRNFTQSAVGQMLLRREGEALVISDLNAAAVGLLGLAPEQLLGTRLDQHLRGRALGSALQAAVQGRADDQRVQVDRTARPGRLDLALSKVSGPGERELFSAQLLDVSQEYDARKRLEAAEKLTSATLDTTDCLILVTDLDGRIVRVNAATTRITGFAASELVGRPVASTSLAPGQSADLDAMFLWPNRSGAPVTRESDLVTRDGRRRRVVWTSNMVRDDAGAAAYAVMTGIDVTSERAAAGLVSSLLQASITTALVGVDGAGLITVFNSGAQRLLDYESGEQIGQPFAGLFDPAQLRQRTGTDDTGTAFAALVAELGDGGELERRDWTWLDRSGVPHEVSMSLSVAEPGSATGGGGGFLCIAQDVTEQRRSQDLLLAALEKERTALERLKSIDDAKNDFVSTVSHELRTPVTSILGYTEMLLDGSVGEPGPDQEPLLATIRRNGQRLIDLCNDLLTLSALDAGTVSWSAERIDLTSLLHGVADTMAPIVAGRDLIFDLELPPAPVVVSGDGAQLERVFINLLSNAVKFTEDGGLVRTTVTVDGDTAVVKVRDTGIGIPAEEQDQLFQRFFRSTTAQRQAIQGTGLGLSIVAAIIEAHGGSVRVRSAHQEGSTFTVSLPLARR